MYWPIFGISSTWDCTCRANSRSTFSRSARIGSKICDRASDVLSTVIQLETLSRPEQGVEIRHGSIGEVGALQSVHLRKRVDHSGHVGGLVPLPAERHRRKERAVRLGEQPFERYAPHGLAQRLGLGEGDD